MSGMGGWRKRLNSRPCQRCLMTFGLLTGNQAISLYFFPSFLCERSKYRAALLFSSWFFCRDCAALSSGWRREMEFWFDLRDGIIYLSA
jgi:hypothetical protein